MNCLWKQSPLSSTEIQQNSDISWNGKAIYEKLNHLQRKKIIHIVDTRKEKTNSINLYAPSISEIDYMESIIKSSPFYHDDMIPSLFQRLIGKITKQKTLQETLDELHEIIEKARRELK